MNFPLRGKFNFVDTIGLDLTSVDRTEKRSIRELVWFTWGWESGQEKLSLYMARSCHIQTEAQASWRGLQHPPWSGSFFISLALPHAPYAAIVPFCIQKLIHAPCLCSYSVWNGLYPFSAQIGLPLCARLSLTRGAAGGQGVNPIHIHICNSTPGSADRDPVRNSKSPELKAGFRVCFKC